MNYGNHLDIFVFPDFFLRQKNRAFSQYLILLLHKALITCVIQLGRIHIHNKRSESEFCLKKQQLAGI